MNRDALVEKAAQALANVENGGNVEASDRAVAAVILDAVLPQVSTMAELKHFEPNARVMKANGTVWPVDCVIESDFRGEPLTVVWQPEVAR